MMENEEKRREVAAHLAGAEYKMVTAAILLSIALEETKRDPILPHRTVRLWSLALSTRFEADDALRLAFGTGVIPEKDIHAIWRASMSAKRFGGYGLDFGAHETLEELVNDMCKEMATSGWNTSIPNRIEIVIP